MPSKPYQGLASLLTRPLPYSRPKSLPPRNDNHYFDNDYVEYLLSQYLSSGCTSIELRDQIMSHMPELIINVIRTQNLHVIYGQDDAALGDLFQVAYVQIEKTLYKYNDQPGHTKAFNLYSQIIRTVALAYIKHHTRDRLYVEKAGRRCTSKSSRSVSFERFLSEARDICQYNDEHLLIIKAIEELYDAQDCDWIGLQDKIKVKTGLSRLKVTDFFWMIRLRSLEFTDAPMNQETQTDYCELDQEDKE